MGLLNLARADSRADSSAGSPADGGAAGEHGSILDAALAAFLDLWIRRTSVGDIARRAGTSPATLYRKFPGKQALVEAVVMREINATLARVDAAMTKVAEDDIETQLVTLILTVTSQVRRHRLVERLLATEPTLLLPMLTTDAAPVIALGRDYLASFLARWQAEGRIADFDPAPYAESLARLALSWLLTPQTLVPLEDAASLRPYIAAHVLPAIRPAD
jgi:AcrR family transcriptional regulator